MISALSLPSSTRATSAPGGLGQFRFLDTNPNTGRPLTRSRYRDLPEHAATVLTDLLRIDRHIWDDAVTDGDPSELVDPRAIYRVIGRDVFEYTGRDGRRYGALTGLAAQHEWESM